MWVRAGSDEEIAQSAGGQGGKNALAPLLTSPRELATVIERHPLLARRSEGEQHQVGVQEVGRVEG